ncbi:hypothetical protein D3C78_1220230 [compost metagenome]
MFIGAQMRPADIALAQRETTTGRRPHPHHGPGRTVFHRKEVPPGGAQATLGRVVGRYHVGILGVGHTPGNHRPIRIAAQKGNQDFCAL